MKPAIRPRVLHPLRRHLQRRLIRPRAVTAAGADARLRQAGFASGGARGAARTTCLKRVTVVLKVPKYLPYHAPRSQFCQVEVR